jgi:hypothetical protein
LVVEHGRSSRYTERVNATAFVERVSTEPERSTEIDVRVPSAELRREIQLGPKLVSDLLADPRHTVERRIVRKGHVLGPPAPACALDDWHLRWPRHPLPADLAGLVSRFNGIHLWANLSTGRSYEGLAPIAEWDLARTKMYGAHADEALLAEEYLAISYNEDCAAFVVLNVDTGRYYYMDACGPDESCLIGDSVDALLDWLWKNRLP